MALVTVQRSPSVSSSPQSSDSGAGAPVYDDEAARNCKSLSECYIAGKGAALVLPPNERARPSRRVSAAGCDIQQHLQSMFYLLRQEETLKMAVKLESVHPGRTRYLVVVSCTGRQDAEESCLLGIDCNARTTVGLVLRVLADTAITLDGDGGFSVSVCGRQHIFKPVSVQAMWSALQTLHKVSKKAREQNYFSVGLSHDWVSYYEQKIDSERSCLNEWNAMDNLESRRPPSPDSVRNKPSEREETERVIRSTLKEIMMSVDLDEVTSKYIRGRLEEDLDMDLGEYKPFIDQEMLTILGQMDAPTAIFDHVYLGSEWNASNLEELQKNGVRHILNVTREIDNFFPGMFNYKNVRVYDDDKTDLLKYWDDTFKYISKAKNEGSKVLVHCKMGVSRSASVVIAYAMKAYNWDFSQALKHVKDKRNCIKPNNSFLLQLETYQGILDAMKNREKLQRSKSDTNLKSPTTTKNPNKKEEKTDATENHLTTSAGVESKKNCQRPKSWSPNVEVGENILPSAPLSQSLESIDKSGAEVTREDLLRVTSQKPSVEQEARNVLMPCNNGQSYSVSQNKIVHLPGPETPTSKHSFLPPILEPQDQRRKGLVLNLTNQFEAASSKPSSPLSEPEHAKVDKVEPVQNVEVPSNSLRQSINTVHLKKETWDPGEDNKKEERIENVNLVWRGSEEAKCEAMPMPAVSTGLVRKSKGDPFSAQVDRVFEREERRDSPSRQSSWSSYDSAVVMDNNSVHSSWATLPSRNSSWGSYDMRPADPLGSSGLFPYNKEEIPWHPGTVKRTKQKLEENTTVKRVCTQNLESEDKTDRSTIEPEELVVDGYNPAEILHYARRDSSEEERGKEAPKDVFQQGHSVKGIDISMMAVRPSARLSTSAPAPSSLSQDPERLSLRSCRSESETSASVVNTTQCPSVKQHKMALENLNNKQNFNKSRCMSVDDSPETESPRSIPGIVMNLKKEFEAKSSSRMEKSPEGGNCDDTCMNGRQKRDGKIRSLPSSPVIGHGESKMQSSRSIGETKDKAATRTEKEPSMEDMSVRVLVGKYEDTRRDYDVPLRNRDGMEAYPPAKSKIAPEFQRRSAPMIINHPPKIYGDAEAPGRPPVPTPSVVVTSVVAKAASKKQQQQHGRTHPLARLQVRPRHSSPVYNTM